MKKADSKPLLKKISFWMIVIALTIALFIIFISPFLFESLESLTLRLLIALSLFFTTLTLVFTYALFVKDDTKKKIYVLLQQLKEKKQNSSVIEKKVQDLKLRFYEAMRIVKNSSIYKEKHNAGYELPWYLLVGAETEGKTSMLEFSGLDFPLNINYEKKGNPEEDAHKSFQWYFGEEAIFVDMPGKYISNTRDEEDIALWNSFLSLFRKKRWKRPINGILLTVSVETLINKTEQELETYAKALRDRFDEVSQSFMSNIPIYLIVTKVDQINGFYEYFRSLTEDEKEEVLGVTFDDGIENIDATVVKPELEQLIKRLNSAVLDNVHKEWDNSARTKILVFCSEFSKVFENLYSFVDTSFAQTRYRKPLMLRGIYFTSIYNTNNSLNESQEFEKSSLNSLSKKGIFIQKLLSNIIFPEADIIKMDTNYKKNQRFQQIATFVISILVIVVGTIFWIQDFNNRLDTLEALKENLVVYDTSRDQVNEKTDFENLLGLLNQMHNLRDANQEDMNNAFWRIAYFKVEDRNQLIERHYRESLENLLLPRIAKSIENQLTSNLSDHDLTWENTKAYAMLHNHEKLDKDFMRAWLSNYWSHTYPNKDDVQNDLNTHFDELLSYGFTPYQLNEEIIKTARARLLEIGYESLVYKSLRDEAKQRNFIDFTFSHTLGSYASAFQGSDYTVPGFYTKEGFQKVIIKDGKELIQKLVNNNWVIGYSSKLTDLELNDLYSKVQNFYFIDYKEHWMRALSSLDIPQYKSIAELNNQLTVLTSASSPIISVLKALKENTLIYTPAEELQMKIDKKLKGGENIPITSKQALKEAQKTMSSTSVKNIRAYFESYNQLLDENDKPSSELTTAMFKLNNVYQIMTAIYGSVSPERDAYNIVLERIAGRHEPIIMPITKLPSPVDRWFKKALKNDWEFLLSRTNKYINQKFELEVLGYFNEKIKNRYPLNRSNKHSEVRVEHFEEFFKKNGVLDSFYTTYVSHFVNLDTRNKRFHYRTIDGSNMYVKKEFIQAMLKAEEIRKMFFNYKGEVLETTLFIKPNSLSRKLSRMEFYYAENTIGYEHGPIKSTKITWPIESSSQTVKFMMYDLQKNNIVEEQVSGEWALYRLMDKFVLRDVKYTKQNPIMVIDYKKDVYDSSVEVSGNSVNMFTKKNPFKNYTLGSGL
jgi:type VI secretion system protein ImpL